MFIASPEQRKTSQKKLHLSSPPTFFCPLFSQKNATVSTCFNRFFFGFPKTTTPRATVASSSSPRPSPTDPAARPRRPRRSPPPRDGLPRRSGPSFVPLRWGCRTGPGGFGMVWLKDRANHGKSEASSISKHHFIFHIQIYIQIVKKCWQELHTWHEAANLFGFGLVTFDCKIPGRCLPQSLPRPDLQAKCQTRIERKMSQMVHRKMQFLPLRRLLKGCPIDARIENEGIELALAAERLDALRHRTQIRQFAERRLAVDLGIRHQVGDVLRVGQLANNQTTKMTGDGRSTMQGKSLGVNRLKC